MKFLFAIYKYFPWAGLQKDTLRLIQEAISRGHDVTVFTTSWQGDVPKGVHLEMVKCGGWTNHARMADFERRFQEFVRNNKFDSTMAMNRICGANFYFVADTCQAVALPRKHNRLVISLLPRYRAILSQEAALCADSKTTFLYLADKQKDDFQKAYNMSDSRFVHLPPGMDPRCIRPDNAEEIRMKKRRELEISENELVAITVGTNLKLKGIDRALKSVAAMAARGMKMHYIAVGNDNPADFYRMARQAGIESHVKYLKGRNDVPEILLAADIMLHPAREEGAGATLTEGIASGLPVICTEVCGFAPFVASATNTVLPEPFSQEQQDDLLEKCLKNINELKARTIAYAKTQDFCGRSRVAIDLMERKW